MAVGVGRGIFLQLLRLSRETGPGHVGGRQGGRREWGGRAGGGGKEPPPGQPQAHLQENSGWESAGNRSDPGSPGKTRPSPSETVDPAASRWPLRAWGWAAEAGGPRSCQVDAARGNVREVSVSVEPKGLRNSCASPPPPPVLPKAPATRDPGWQPHSSFFKYF